MRVRPVACGTSRRADQPTQHPVVADAGDRDERGALAGEHEREHRSEVEAVGALAALQQRGESSFEDDRGDPRLSGARSVPLSAVVRRSALERGW